MHPRASIVNHRRSGQGFGVGWAIDHELARRDDWALQLGPELHGHYPGSGASSQSACCRDWSRAGFLTIPPQLLSNFWPRCTISHTVPAACRRGQRSSVPASGAGSSYVSADCVCTKSESMYVRTLTCAHVQVCVGRLRQLYGGPWFCEVSSDRSYDSIDSTAEAACSSCPLSHGRQADIPR